LQEAEGKLDVAEKSLESKRGDIDNNEKMPPEERSRRLSEISELEVNIIHLRAQRDLQLLKKSELMVKSPIDGTVMTWLLKERLNARPLQMGQELMRIADLGKEWQLELHMPDQRMGFVEAAQQDLYLKEREELRKLLLEEEQATAAKTAANAPADAAAKVPDTSQPAADGTAPATGPVAPAAGESSSTPGESAKNPPEAAPAEDLLAAKVDAELAKIPDDKLHDRWSQYAKAKLDAQLQEILKDFPDGDAKQKLSEVLLQPNYEQAWEQLSALIKDLPVDKLKSKLAAIDQMKFVDETVTFILATDPATKLKGRITEITKSAEIHGDEGNTVLIKVAIDKSQIKDLQAGATVTAQVRCGRRPLGYVWFHEIVSFIQSKILFRYF
jgi:hypothetical protein